MSAEALARVRDGAEAEVAGLLLGQVRMCGLAWGKIMDEMLGSWPDRIRPQTAPSSVEAELSLWLTAWMRC